MPNKSSQRKSLKKAPGKTQLRIAVVNESQSRIPQKFLLSWAKKLSRQLERRGLSLGAVELSLVFLDPAPAKKINREFRKKNYATDVLSFQGDVDQGFLGELVICPEVLKIQAKQHGLSFQAELGYMVIHGVLHLLGYDHERSQKEADAMLGLQDQIFDKMTRAL